MEQKKIALCMIVKDESAVIERCIASVQPLIDYVLIVDTGSTDGTQGIIMNYLDANGIQGEVIDEPFINFAYNRTFALEQLRQHQDIDYCLMIDADEQLIFDDGFSFHKFKQGLIHDAYEIQTRHGGCYYNRTQLFSNRLPFYFKSVLHEYLECGQKHRRVQAEGFYNLYGLDGARSKNPKKYHDDAQVLKTALLTETEPFLIARYTFYLANSYRDAGELALAIPEYIKRTMMGFWKDEVYLSLLNVARLKERLNHPVDEVIQSYMSAVEYQPHRAEAFLGAMRVCRFHNRHYQAYLLGLHSKDLPVPPRGSLFVEYWVYQYGLLDEFSVAANNVGQYVMASQACSQLLESDFLPDEWRKRVQANQRHATYQIASRSFSVDS